VSFFPYPPIATRFWITRTLKELEKDPDPGKFQRFLTRCEMEGTDLTPWERRIEGVRRRVLVAEVMRS